MVEEKKKDGRGEGRGRGRGRGSGRESAQRGDGAEQSEISSRKRLPKRKFALLVAYSGENYQGLQM